MKFIPSISKIYFSVAIIFFALLGSAGWATLQSEPAKANLENLNQCYDPTNTTQALIQVGLFVDRNDYKVNSGIQVGNVIKNGWSYTYFSGSSPEEIIGLRVDAGETLAKVTNKDGTDSVETTVDLSAVGKYTILAYGSGRSGKQPVQIGSLTDDLTPISVGKGKVRVIHASGFHSNLNNLILDVQYNAGEEIVLNNLEFGGQGYFEVDPGSIKIRAVDQSGNFPIFDIKPFDVEDGELVTLILYGDDAGSMDVYTLEDCQSVYRYNQLVAPPQFPEFNGEINFINLAPSSSQLAETELSLLMNGGVQFENQPYGSSTGSKEIEAAVYTAQVKAANSDIVIAKATVDVEIGKSYTLVASGGAGGNDFDLTVLEDDGQVPPGQFGLVRFGNFVSDGANPNKLRLIDEGTSGFQLSDISYTETADPAYQIVGAGEYDFEVQRGPVSLIDPRPVTLTAGSETTLLAAGNGTDQPYGVFKIEGGSGEFIPLEVARLYVAHLAPFAQTAEGTDIALKINGELISNFSRYGDSTGYLALPAGPNLISVEKNGSSLASQEVTLVGNQDYSIYLTGSNESIAFSALLSDQSNIEGDAGIRFGHVAPTLGSINFSDFSTTWAEDLAYPQIDEQLQVKSAGNFNLSVTNDQGVEIIDPAAVQLSTGDVATFLAVADLNLNGHAVYAIINGQKGVFLNPDADLAHLYVANLLALDSRLEDSSVNVRLNGEPLVNGLDFGESTPGLIEIPVGGGLIEVLPSNSTAPLISQQIEVQNDGVYRLLLHGDANSAEMLFSTQLNFARQGTVRLTAGNLVPPGSGFLSSVNIYQDEDLIAGALDSGEMLTNFVTSNSTVSKYKVTTSDGSAVLLESPEISFADNSAVTLITAGDGGVNQPFGLFAIVNNEPMVLLPSVEGAASAPPRLSIAHFSPSSVNETSSVAVRLNGVIINESMGYGDMMFDVEGAIGSNKIEILDAVSLNVLETENSPFLTRETPYIYLVTGGANGIDLALFGYPFTDEPSAENANYSFFNAAPVMQSATDRRMNLTLAGTETYTLTDVEFGQSAHGTAAAGTYDPIVESPDGLTVYSDPGNVTLSQNDQVVFVAVGDGGSQEVSLYQFQLNGGSVSGAKLSNIPDPTNLNELIYLPFVVR